MAKNLGLLQNGSGKIGNVVLQRNNVQRVRKRQISNPRTQAQQISRMIAATATRTYSALKGIVDHSFQGIPYGGKSMNYFLKHAMHDLRNYALQWQDGQPTDEGFGYVPKQRYGAVPGEFEVSKGTLGSIGSAFTITNGTAKSFGFKIGNNFNFPTPAQLTAVGVQAGDQITFLCVDCSDLDDGKSPVVRVVRLVTTAEFDGTANSWDATYYDAVKTDASVVACLVGRELSQVFGVSVNIKVGTGCIILSRPVGNTWGRSNERLQWAGDTDDWSDWGDYLYNNALDTWMEEGVTIGESDRYLNEGL